MKIIIPMSGFGERFRKAGYIVPKPLIEVEGKPIIAHVVEMFPGEADFIFICSQEHLDNPDYRMREILTKLMPSARILGIAPHKLGPVHAVLQAEEFIHPQEEIIINYCDFTCYWNWPHFRRFVKESHCDGAIPAYKGFHPHTLGTTNYAYMREQHGWVLDIQEKQPYTANRMEEYASSGTYYYASGALMLEAVHAVKQQDLNVNGEYYASLTYKPLIAAGKKIAVYPLQHFMQWGTPADLAEYNNWSRIFRRLLEAPQQVTPHGSVVVPMAGLGQRFANEGYTIAKPLIPVSGRPMVLQATNDLPPAQHYAFVLRSDMPDYEKITRKLREQYPEAVIETVPQVTEGQACTARIGLDALAAKIGKDALGSVTFGACDNGMLYDAKKMEALIADPSVDIILWGARGHAHAIRHPGMYGWIDTDGTKVKSVSVKTPLKSPETDPIVVGTFTFRRAEDFYRALERLIARDGRVNGEFYLDSCINDALALGLNCHLMEVDGFISWGTPKDLKTFEYWQSCFHQWQGHPYRLEHDSHVPASARDELEKRYMEQS